MSSWKIGPLFQGWNSCGVLWFLQAQYEPSSPGQLVVQTSRVSVSSRGPWELVMHQAWERQTVGTAGGCLVPGRCQSAWGERIHTINFSSTQDHPLLANNLTDEWRVACKGLILLMFGPQPIIARSTNLQFESLIKLNLNYVHFHDLQLEKKLTAFCFYLWSQNHNFCQSMG